MSSHMLAPCRRAWQDEQERETDDAEDTPVVCAECKQPTDLDDTWPGRNFEPVCFSCWFATCPK